LINRAAIENLKKQVRGEILQPSDSAYDEARSIYNAMIDRRPAVIIRCTGTGDAVAGVHFARENELPLSIRSGGHGVSGNAVCHGGVMLDMSKLKSIEIDRPARTAKAQPGMTLGDFDKATTAQKLVTTMGVVSMTGITGLTLGGGLGWLMGKYGLACDNLIGAKVVTAEGKTLHASEDENSDLLWALRGGGGNFGVVTELEYRLHPLEPMLGGMLLYPVTKAKEVLSFYREATQNSLDELTLDAALLNGPDGKPVCGMVAAYNGDPATGEKVLKPIRAFGPPLADMVGPVTYVQHQSMLDAAYPPGQYHYWKGSFIKSVSDEVIGVMTEQFLRCPSKLTSLFLEHLHGAASRVPATATAFPHRFDHYNFGAFGIWADPKDTEANLKWVQEFWQAARPYVTKRAYVNYLNVEGEERVREAYGPNYDRLAALKKKYDPTNFFRLNQNIPPSS
jgi:FAD/FMN-containing dehydrogenase